MSDKHSRRIRARMGETGENYTTARTRLSKMAKIPSEAGPWVELDEDGPMWPPFTLTELAAMNWGGDGQPRYTTDPTDVQHDNTIKAGWALAALVRYREIVGGDDETCIPDFLADLMHLCDALGLDFAEYVRQAYVHHDPEADGRD